MDNLSIQQIMEQLKIDESIIRQWCDRGLVNPQFVDDVPFFVEEDLERFKVISNLMHDLDVNLEGVEVILGMRDRMIGMERWIRDVFKLLDENHLLSDEMVAKFKSF